MGRPRQRLDIHQEAGQIAKLEKAEQSGWKRERLQVIRLGLEGELTYEQIASASGRCLDTIRRWFNAFREGGVQRLLERESGRGPDARNRLTARAAEELKAGLEAGRWRTGPQVRQWLQQEHNIQIAEGTVYKYLGKFAARLKVPRKSHVKRDPLKVEVFKATLADKLGALNIPAGKPVRLWVMDEARFGLHTEHRRVWSLRGVRVVVPHQQKYEWQYVIGALEVGKAGSEFAYVPTMNTQITAEFFKQIARHDPGSVHVVIYDGAGFHPDDHSPLLPENVRIIKLPPYSPELNPVEGLWDQLRDAIANKVFATLDALEEALTAFLRPLWSDAKRIFSLVLHPWLNDQTNDSFGPVLLI
jgi:transposase